MNEKNTVILGCSSLKDPIEQAQRQAGTSFPVLFLNRLYHRDPAEMRAHILDALKELPEEISTVLVAMGYCGGSWEQVKVPCRLVMPRVDDCISLLLQCGDEPSYDLKEPGHLYIREKDPGEMSFRRIFEHMTKDIDEETRKKYHDDWKQYYHEIDIIDTGLYDCRSEEYVEKVRKDADWLEAKLAFVPGGIHLLEKLLRGQWDDQFLIMEPEEEVTAGV
ncbi:MAG: DUF1638 domain-containing protein [Firmicutes bacterium]|nr:DUF1638 domain-containing protein [Bacillota bacterium]